MKRSHRLRVPAIAGVAVAALTVAACSSGASSSGSSPGAGSNSSWALTASAPGFSEIAPASAAYFAYVNANGGVYGRKIVYKYLDDGYNPTTTSQVVRQLVLQDNAYAIFNGLGT